MSIVWKRGCSGGGGILSRSSWSEEEEGEGEDVVAL